MGLVDLIVAIVIVTILVTVVVGVGTYVAYKFRLYRAPSSEDPGETRYFVVHRPPEEAASTGAGAEVGAEGESWRSADGGEREDRET